MCSERKYGMIADVQNVYAVLKVYRNDISNVGDWSNGMTEVSKTFSGSSILSSPVVGCAGSLEFSKLPAFFIFAGDIHNFSWSFFMPFLLY